MDLRQGRQPGNSRDDEVARRENRMVMICAAILVACIAIVLIVIEFKISATLG